MAMQKRKDSNEMEETGMDFDEESDNNDENYESLDFGSDFDCELESDFEEDDFFPTVGGTPTAAKRP